ncbi:DNA-binding transcriptional LysR family regulator [Paucibacter oligotrophus]|uniref:DNA-binding transcriptional LysR family regulator n=1 Tax=Roseateles oligotrophus TaxID=1769250 RepID=A0A840LFZ4_9BURK|nr:LysR family transcriptional regulator [Roseateles oligotrophus]MBB4844959.1 DNA-binding transcriptional LysR family regulator [Roseateles oligotrophus]
MEFYQLRSFVAVARSGHLTRAAEQLHLTQSAVSKQLRALEEELGLALFERSASGMSLTGAGRRLLPAALRAVDSVQDLQGLARSLHAQVGGRLRLGTIIDPESIQLGGLLGHLLQSYPLIDVQLQHGISGTVLAQLQRGEIDACFYLGELQEAELLVLPLRQEAYVVVGPTAWASALAQADWAALARMPWVGTPPGSSQHILLGEVFARQGLTHRCVVEADQEASMIELMRSGVALCLMRTRLARQLQAQGQAVIWAGTVIPCPLSMLMPRKQQHAPVLSALRECLGRLWPQSGEGLA